MLSKNNNNIVYSTLLMFIFSLLSIPALAHRAHDKMNICHWQEESEAYELISIETGELEKHLEMGDVLSEEYALDYDFDGYTAVGSPILPCPEVYFILKRFALGEDCDDIEAFNHPGAKEICDDGMDNNCDGIIDEEEICTR